MTDTTQGGLGNVIFDNRFRLRRDKVEADEGRLRLRRLIWVACAAVLALVVVIAIDSALLDIDEVTVSGSTHATADQLLAGAGVERGDALITLDLGAVERRLEAMPWVDTAAVERSLPGSLSISINERIPTTIITADDSAALIDGSGRVLALGDTTTMTSEFADSAATGASPIAVRAASLDALVAGEDVSGDVALSTEIASDLAKDLTAVVAAVSTHDGRFSLELRSGGTVDLGSSDDLDHKIDAFRVMVSRVDFECLATLDLRVSTRPVLTRDTTCS